ncbi:MAG: nucleotidyltransferase domain-containing protein [Gammaproteobacteria bacterium]
MRRLRALERRGTALHFKEHFLTSLFSDQTSSGAPEGVARIADIMASYPGRWSLCGGWAVDAWLGRVSREHGDIDLSVFVEDQRALHDHLAGWQLLAHDAAWEPGRGDQWWDGTRRLGCPSHIHARPPERAGEMPKDGIATLEDGFLLDIQINDLEGDAWLLSRLPAITLGFERAVQQSPWGMPTASPEVVLFFKARDLRRRDKVDFAALLPLLSAEQRAWLKEAVVALGHPWVRELSV